ncbi:DUF5986 family protein [Heyndrickxia sporothermodurans]|nr:DUF5986 family protein [Heyndrickxia sporothermodurans]MBL5794170.1 hypothetical protein [Heyndrickxia sporothermodurans]
MGLILRMSIGVGIGMDETVIGSLVKAFALETKSVTNEVKLENDWHTRNFENGGSWDTRFGRITKSALEHGLVVLQRKRGTWEFVVVLNTETGFLYVFSKEKNFDIVQKKFGKNKIHYFHAFVSINSGPVDLDDLQQELFPRFPEEYEQKRIEEVRKILGEEYPHVNRIVFVIGKEESKRIVNVEAKLYNRYFELVDMEDWSKYIPSDQYGDIFVPNEQINDEVEEPKVIPKVKQTIKNRKRDGKMPTRKTEKERKEDKGM